MSDDSNGDDLEVYIAAGIDVPTALVLADEDRTPPEPQTSRTGNGSAIAIGIACGRTGLACLAIGPIDMAQKTMLEPPPTTVWQAQFGGCRPTASLSYSKAVSGSPVRWTHPGTSR